MKRLTLIVLAVFVGAVVLSFFGHWSIGARVSGHTIRLEAMSGEAATSLWIASPDYGMNAPVFFIRPVETRTSLSDAAPRSKFGIGWLRSGKYLRGSKTIGVVAAWPHYLAGLLLLLGAIAGVCKGWRSLRLRTREQAEPGQQVPVQ